jgi:hypothetical protein
MGQSEGGLNWSLVNRIIAYKNNTHISFCIFIWILNIAWKNNEKFFVISSCGFILASSLVVVIGWAEVMSS